MLIEDVSIEDAKKLLDKTPEHELDPHEDDAFFLDILHPASTKEEELDEARVLDFAHRQRLAQRMRLLAPRYARLRKLKAKRLAPNDRILYRARKAALNSLRRKVAGKLGESYMHLSRQQKIQVDTMVLERYGKGLHEVVNRIAQRLLPKVRKKEFDRVRDARLVSEKQTERANYGQRPWIDQNVSDDPLHFPTYPQTIKPQEIYAGKFLVPDAKGKNNPEADETEDTTGEFRLFGPTRKKNTMDTTTASGEKGRLQLRGLDEARKSASGAGGDEVENRHIADHLLHSVRNPSYVIPWTEAKPSALNDQDFARTALSTHDNMVKRIRNSEAAVKFVRDMGRSPEHLRLTVANLKRQMNLKEAEEVEVLKSMKRVNKIWPDQELPYKPAPTNSKTPAIAGIQEEFEYPAQQREKLKRERTVPRKKRKPHPMGEDYGSFVRQTIQEASRESQIPYGELYGVYLDGTEYGNFESALDAVFDYVNEQQISVRRIDPQTGEVVYKTVNKTRIRRKPRKRGYSRKIVTAQSRRRVYEGVEIGTDDSVLTYAAATPGQDSVRGYSRAEFSNDYPEVDLERYADRNTGKSDNTYWQRVSDAIKGIRR